MRPFVLFHQPAFRGEAVPGTDGQAIVAAVDPISDERAKVLRDRAFQLNREIGDAAARIELEGAADRLGWTGGEATGTGAATVFLRRIGIEFQSGDNLGEQKPITQRA